MKARLISFFMLATLFGTSLTIASGGDPDFDYEDPEVYMVDNIYYRIIPGETEVSVASPKPYYPSNLYPEDRKSMIIPSTITYNGEVYTVTKIEGGAFNCEAFETLSIPATVKDFDLSRMSSCEELATLTVDEENEWYKSVDNILHNKDMSRLLLCPQKRMDYDIAIPEGVEEIESRAFYAFSKKSITKITFPSTLRIIGNEGLAYFKAESFKLPEGLECLQEHAFYGASAADSTLVIPSTVTAIGKGCFADTYFKTMVLPDNIDRIIEFMFYGSDIAEIRLPESVEIIDEDAFADAKSLKSIELPENLRIIGEEAFSESGLTSIAIRSKVSVLDEKVFAYCDSLKSVTIGESVREIYDSFIGCASLTDIYCEGMIAPVIDEVYPLGKDKEGDNPWMDLPIFTGATIHVRPGARVEYAGNGWDKIGPIVEDLPSGISDINDDTAIGDDELCEAYSLSGVAVDSSLHIGETNTRLPKGIYIIRTASGKSAKIYVK